MRPKILALAALLALAIAPTARPQDGPEVTLALRFSAGDAWSFDESTDFCGDVKILANGQLAQTMSQARREVERGESAVVAAENGKITELRVHFAPECAEVNENAGQSQTRTPGYAGKTYTIKRVPGGEATIDGPPGLTPDEQKKPGR